MYQSGYNKNQGNLNLIKYLKNTSLLQNQFSEYQNHKQIYILKELI